MSNLEELQLLNALVNDMLFSLPRRSRRDQAEDWEDVALGSRADKAILLRRIAAGSGRGPPERSGDTTAV